jgi:organic radical activating enzyme
MKKWEILPAWSRILQGYRPFLAVEVTRECPLRCPGCYAYDAMHLNNGKVLRQISELQGDDLVDGILELIHRHRPIHLSIVGGEPLLRYREMDVLLHHLNCMDMEVQFITSAVRPIPASWARLANLHLVVSVDGLQEEHDRRRAPASYERILHNIAGHRVIIHCVIMRSMLAHPGYFLDFASFWSNRNETRQIWFSIYTPQDKERSQERLTAQDRTQAIEAITQASSKFPIVYAPRVVIDGYRHPPSSPSECLFAQTTRCIAPDLKTTITPCQLGGRPVCSECGCFASVGIASIGDLRLAGLVKLSDLFRVSRWIGENVYPEHAYQSASQFSQTQYQSDNADNRFKRSREGF